MERKIGIGFVARFLEHGGNDPNSGEISIKPEKEDKTKKRVADVGTSTDSKTNNDEKCPKCGEDVYVDYKGDEKITTCMCKTTCGFVKRERISDPELKDSDNVPTCIYCKSEFVIEEKTTDKIKITCKDGCGFSFVLEKLEPIGWTALDSWTPRQKERVSNVAIPSSCQQCKPGTDIKVIRDGNRVNFKCTKCDYNGMIDPDNGLFTSTWNMTEKDVDTVRILIRKVQGKDHRADDSGIEDNSAVNIAPAHNCEHCNQIMEIIDVEEMFDKDGKFNVYTLECKNPECAWIVKKGSGIHEQVRASKLQPPQQSEEKEEKPEFEPEEAENENISDDQSVAMPIECSYCPAELKLVDAKDDFVKYECKQGCGYSVSIYPSERPEHSTRRVVKEEWQAPAGSDTVLRIAQDMQQSVDAKNEHADCPHCTGKLEERDILPYINLITGQNIDKPYLFRCNNSDCLYNIHYDHNEGTIVEFWELDPDEYIKIVEQAKKEFIKQIKQDLKDKKYILNEGDRCPVENCSGTLIILPTVAKANGTGDEEAVILSCSSCSWSWSTAEPIGDALNVTPEKCPICTSYYKVLNADGQKWCPACLKSKEELIEIKKKRDEEEKRRKEEEKKKREQEALEKMRAEGKDRLAAEGSNKDDKKPEADDELDDNWFNEEPEDRPFDAKALKDPAAEGDSKAMPDPQLIPEDGEPDPVVESPLGLDAQPAFDESNAESDTDEPDRSDTQTDKALDEKLQRLEAHLLKFGPLLEDFVKNKAPDLVRKDQLQKHQIRIDELNSQFDEAGKSLAQLRKKMLTGDAAAKRIQGVENSVTSLREDLDEVNGKVQKKLEEKKFWQPPRVYKFIIPTVLGVLLFLFIFLGLPYYMVDSKVAEIENLKTSFVQKEDLVKSAASFKNAVKEMQAQNAQRKADDTKLENKIADIDKRIIAAKTRVDRIITVVNSQADILADIQIETDLIPLQNQLNLLSAQVNDLKAELAQYATKKDLSDLPANQVNADKLDQMQKDIAALKTQVQGLVNVQKQQNDAIKKQQTTLAARQQAAQTQPAQPQAAPGPQVAQPAATPQPAARPQVAQPSPAAQPQPTVQPAPRSRRPYSRPAYRSRQRRESGALVISGQGKKSGRYKGIGFEYECYGMAGCDSPLTIK